MDEKLIIYLNGVFECFDMVIKMFDKDIIFDFMVNMVLLVIILFFVVVFIFVNLFGFELFILGF